MLITGADTAKGAVTKAAALAEFRNALVGAANTEGDTFADFRRRSQNRLFQLLDRELSRAAEENLHSRLSFVRKARIDLQTSLGNRKGAVGVDVIGAFSESDNSAFGWQLRAYGAESDAKGANAGIFYRRIYGAALLGGNAFLDYEDNAKGKFYRWSIGGEVKTPLLHFAANRYIPVTDDKRKGVTVTYSRPGYDANLRVNIPNLHYLKARADYYNFDGKYGGKNDSGFRYGFELHPFAGLQVGAFYDGGGEEFGGKIAYAHTFGETPQQPQTGKNDDPRAYLFAAVEREHTQRIAVATDAPQTFIGGTVTLTTNVTTTTDVVGDTVTMTTRQTATMNVTVTSATATMTVMETVTTTMTATTTMTVTETMTVTTTMTMIQEIAALAAVLSEFKSQVFVTGFLGTVVTVTPAGGFRVPGNPYTYTAPAGFQVSDSGIVRFQSDTAGTITATITADDDTLITPPVSLMLTVTAVTVCNLFFTGCPAVGHASSSRDLTLIRMAVFAGANINSGLVVNAGITATIGHIYLLRLSTNRMALWEYLLEQGANINFVRIGDALAGDTVLDIDNDLGGQTRAFLLANGARCNRTCRIGQTDINGQVCTRDTNRSGVPALADCRP